MRTRSESKAELLFLDNTNLSIAIDSHGQVHHLGISNNPLVDFADLGPPITEYARLFPPVTNVGGLVITGVAILAPTLLIIENNVTIR